MIADDLPWWERRRPERVALVAVRPMRAYDDAKRRLDRIAEAHDAIRPLHWHDGVTVLTLPGPAVERAAWECARAVWDALALESDVRVACDVSAWRDWTEPVPPLLDLMLRASPDRTILATRSVSSLLEPVELGGAVERTVHHAVNAPLLIFPGDAPVEASAPEDEIERYVLVRRFDSSLADPNGLLDPEKARTAGARTIERAVRESRGPLLVVAPPWTGKSHVARALENALRRRAPYVWLLDLEEIRFDEPGWLPHDWRKWIASGEVAHLIVDAVDEALHRGHTLQTLAGELRELDARAQARLRLIFFARDDDTPDKLAVLWRPEVVHLLPFDTSEAERALGRGSAELGARRLRQARERLEQAGLIEWAQHEPVLQSTADLEGSPDPGRIREAVLRRLCAERGPREERHRDVAPTELLRVAGRIAALTCVTNRPVLGHDHPDVVPMDLVGADGPTHRAMMTLLHTGALLFRTPDGWRFRQRHAEELLAAAALHDVRIGVLRGLLTDAEHGLRPELDALAEELVRMRPDDAAEIAAWRQRSIRPWTLDRAVAIVDRIEELARAGRLVAFADRNDAVRLDEARAVILDRIRRAETPPGARDFFLGLARRGAWREVVSVALELALAGGDSEVRAQAAYVVLDLGGPEERIALRPLLADRKPEIRGLRHRLLLAELEGGADPLEVAAQAEPPEELHYDLRSQLVEAVAERIELPHARAILDTMLEPEGARTRGVAIQLLDRLREPAADRLLAQTDAGAQDVDRLVSVLARDGAFGELSRKLEKRFAESASWRRAFYPRLRGRKEIERLVRWPPDEDAAWLIERVRRGDSAVEELEWLSQRPTGEAREEVRSFLRSTQPERLAAWDRATEERRARVEAQHREWEERKRAERLRRPRLWLGALVEDALATTAMSADGRWLGGMPVDPGSTLGWFGQVCFYGSGAANVDGRFEDLDAETQLRVHTRVRELLANATPTSLPVSTSFPASIVFEAAAFEATVCWDDPSEWLTPALVERWLPTSLFAATTDSKDAVETMARVFAVAPEQTILAIVAEMCREAARDRYPFVAQRLPAALWNDSRLIAAALALIEGAGKPEPRAALLRLVSDNAWDRAHAFVHRLASVPGDLRLHAITQLVAHEPSTGLAMLDGAWSNEDLATALSALDLGSLTTSELGRLVALLAARELPARAADEAGIIDASDRLIEIGAVATEALTSRSDDAYEAALAEVSHASQERAQWIRRLRASRDVVRLLTPERSPPPTVREVLAALDGSLARRFRSVDDLAETLVECIHQIDKDSAEDVDVLATSTKLIEALLEERRSPDVDAAIAPHEKVLQTYVRSRLRDVMALRAPRKVVFAPREPNEGKKEPDILVLSESESGERLEVPVEIKWSHNTRCVPSLCAQLGERYLLGSQRARGVYVVGHSGLPPNADGTALEAELRKEASRFQERHPSIRIDVCVVAAPLVPRNAQAAKTPSPKLSEAGASSANVKRAKKRPGMKSAAAAKKRVKKT